MTRPKLDVITLELEDERGGTTVVIRDPFTTNQRVYTAGPASAAEVHPWIERLGLAAPMGRSMTAPLGATAATSRPSSAMRLSSAAALRAHVEADLRAPEELANAVVLGLQALLSAVLRTGRLHRTSAVDEALATLRNLLSGRPLPCLARLISRVEASLDPSTTVEEATLALTALGEASDRLKNSEADSFAQEFLGKSEPSAPLESAELIELGRFRERSGVQWETRLLVDPASLRIFRECGAPGSGELSFGLSGRKLVLNLASELPGIEPHPVRVYQYEVRPRVTPAELELALRGALHSFAALDTLRGAPLRLVAMPSAVLLAPSHIEFVRGGITVQDDEGRRLALIEDAESGVFDTLRELVEKSDSHLRAIVGSLAVRPLGLCLFPWSAVIERSGTMELFQLVL